MFDRGFFITLQAIRRQLAAMPHEIYLVRLIHHTTRRSFPGERLWTATQLGHSATVRFLRMRNREGCDIYIQPFAAQDRNAGYILVDLDRTNPAVIESMRAHGHDPCVVLQTSPGHLQAWIHLSTSPLEPALATAAGKQLARIYGGDLASTDWRHLGRLAGFTNQKPQRRTPGGYAPWVKILHTHPGLARNADGLLRSAIQLPAPAWLATQGTNPGKPSACAGRVPNTLPPSIAAAEATQIYQGWIERWRIAERFPQPDWSIVDFRIARQLLSQGTPAERVRAILQLASPHFPRRHADPDDYLRRTVARAAFPAPRRTVWIPHATASDPVAGERDCSNSTGGR
jgi:RepB DNA-primase N-terminal domain/RepB DNA-primase C-terminal helical domain